MGHILHGILGKKPQLMECLYNRGSFREKIFYQVSTKQYLKHNYLEWLSSIIQLSKIKINIPDN